MCATTLLIRQWSTDLLDNSVYHTKGLCVVSGYRLSPPSPFLYGYFSNSIRSYT